MPRNLFRAILIASAVAAAAPLAPAGAQESTSTSERDREARERERDQERERADRERERKLMRVEVDRAREEGRRAAREALDDMRRTDSARTLDTTVTLGRNGVVDLSLVSGEIVVTGWPRAEAKVHATTEHGQLRFDAASGRLTLDVSSRYGRAGEAHYELSVPEGTRVLMRSISGDLTSRGVKGEVEARTVSGEVSLADATGRVTIESVSGDVTVARVAGDVHGSAVSGDVHVDGVTGDVEYGSVSGEIAVTNAHSRTVHLSAVSGDLTYQGALDAAGRYDFGTHSGEISLRLPADANAAVSVQTFSGELQSDFPLTMRPASAGTGPRRSGQKMEFSLGRGGPRLTAETFSGDITLERGTGRGSDR